MRSVNDLVNIHEHETRRVGVVINTFRNKKAKNKLSVIQIYWCNEC